jgi:hypothetical protein
VPNRRMLRIGSTGDPAAGLSCCYDFPYWIKAGPAGGRLRRPSSAGRATTPDAEGTPRHPSVIDDRRVTGRHVSSTVHWTGVR